MLQSGRKIVQSGILFISILFLLTGCGKEDEALNTYKENITAFCESITAQNDTINAIDPNSDTAVDELLAALDRLNEEFTTLADMDVPDEFSAVETLADEAGNYMNEAVSMYHDVFAADVIDIDTLEIANENYHRSMKRIQYIGDILMGQLPDGDDVSITYEDSDQSEPESESVSG